MNRNDDWWWILWILFLFLFMSCGDRVIVDMRRGVITNKEYHPAWTETTYTKIGDITIPETHHYPEYWTVDVHGDVMYEDDGKIRYVKSDTQTRVVKKAVYDRLNVGDGVWLPGYIKVGEEEQSD